MSKFALLSLFLVVSALIVSAADEVPAILKPADVSRRAPDSSSVPPHRVRAVLQPLEHYLNSGDCNQIRSLLADEPILYYPFGSPAVVGTEAVIDKLCGDLKNNFVAGKYHMIFDRDSLVQSGSGASVDWKFVGLTKKDHCLVHDHHGSLVYFTDIDGRLMNILAFFDSAHFEAAKSCVEHTEGTEVQLPPLMDSHPDL